MKDLVQKVQTMLSDMAAWTLNEDWNAVKCAAEELKQLFFEASRFDFEADRNEPYASVMIRASLANIGEAMSILSEKSSNTSWRREEQYKFLPIFDAIIANAEDAMTVNEEDESEE